jgi:hypothetical protein
MFVRLLAVLISGVLCYFSVLVCCRSLVRIVVQRGRIKQSGSLAPVNAIERTVIEHKSHDRMQAMSAVKSASP